MELTLYMILYFIRDLAPVFIKDRLEDQKFAGVKQFSAETWEMECRQELLVQNAEQYLYIGNLSELYRERELLWGRMMVLAVEDTSLSAEQKAAFPCGLICMNEAYKVPYLMNRMMDVFTRVSNWDKNMHIAALEGKTIQELLDISEEILRRPMIIFDAGFNVLAHTKKFFDPGGNFQVTVEKGYTDAKTMELVKAKNIFPRLKSGEALVAPAAENDDRINVYFSFFCGQTLLGYACVFHDQTEPDPGYLDLLKLFTENLNFCMERAYENRRYGQMIYETFLVNLMNPAASAEQRKEQLKNIENLPEIGRFVLGILSFGEDAKAQLSYIGRLVNREMWDVRPFIYEDCICLLKILGKDDEPIREWEMKNIRKLLNGYEFIFGMSNPFDQIWDLRYAFLQAKAAIQFGRREKKVFCFYWDYYYYHLLSCMEQEMPLSQIQPEFYRQIKCYDAEHQTQYLKMLLVYLECECNATRAAQRLYLHRNTIHNAVHFTEERWGICIADPEIKKLFVLSDLIDRYLAR